jgi:hypothetical protein
MSVLPKFLCAALGLAAMLLVTCPQAQAEQQILDFTILADGDPIGHNIIAIDRQADLTTVKVSTAIEVKLAMITLFHFNLTAEERWRDGKLHYLMSQSNDDGTRHELCARMTNAGLQVESDGTVSRAPASIVPGTLWNPRVTDGSPVLNPVDGKQLAVTVKDLGQDTIKVHGLDTPADHYDLIGEKLEREVWFTRTGMLAKVRFRRMGADIVYELR